MVSKLDVFWWFGTFGGSGVPSGLCLSLRDVKNPLFKPNSAEES